MTERSPVRIDPLKVLVWMLIMGGCWALWMGFVWLFVQAVRALWP